MDHTTRLLIKCIAEIEELHERIATGAMAGYSSAAAHILLEDAKAEVERRKAMPNPDEIFAPMTAKEFRHWRAAAALSVSQAAAVLDISRRSVQLYQSGKQKIPLKIKQAILELKNIA